MMLKKIPLALFTDAKQEFYIYSFGFRCDPRLGF